MYKTLLDDCSATVVYGLHRTTYVYKEPIDVVHLSSDSRRVGHKLLDGVHVVECDQEYITRAQS